MHRVGTRPTGEARRESGSAPSLVLGPLLRYVGESEATVWVETDGACEVEVLLACALVPNRRPSLRGRLSHGPRAGSVQRYEVALDGEPHWPIK